MTEETLFHEALAKPPAERAAFLDAACVGQPQLRVAVEALLVAHEASGSFLRQPAIAALEATGAHSPQPDEAPPHLVPTTDHRPQVEPGIVIAGRYTLQEKIGEGGMGEVWVAKQTEPVKRKVALKLIKTGMDSKAVFGRFEQERQALAMMDHPNIARVLDGGIDLVSEPRTKVSGLDYPLTIVRGSGMPFFVMELVNGLPLTKFCDEARLTPKERLELFVPICQAVQHAHQKGIVHRDLKPSNILVTLIDGKAIPKVIDFGVAKATGGKLTDESLSTKFGAIVGTLEYMSPEQAGFSGVDVDTRADIYSLGVILYELLTGLRPIDAKRLRQAAYTEMIRIIQEEEPSKPSTRLSTDAALPSLAAARQTEPKKLMALLRGELDWVVMKCLEKSRERRYETTNALSRDIQRYLADEPVEARSPSAGYRLGKFLKRNKGPVVAVGVVLAALFAGIVGTTIGLVRATMAEEVALRRYEEAEAERSKAAASAKAEAEQRQKAEKAEADTLADYRASTDDVIEQLIGSKPQLGPKERTYLENTLKRWQVFAARQGDDQRSRAIRAEGHFRVALLWHKLGRTEVALAEFQAARAVWKKLAEQFPAAPEYQENLGHTHNNLGSLLVELGKHDEAHAEKLAACEIFMELVARFDTVPAYQYGLARTYLNLGALFAVLGKGEKAWTQYQEARDILKKLVRHFPAEPIYEQSLATTHYDLGLLLVGLEKREEAQTEYEAARDIRKKLVAQFPAIPVYQQVLAETHHNLGALLNGLGKGAEARAEYQAALDLLKELVSQFPAVPAYEQVLALVHKDLGNQLKEIGMGEEARAEFLVALDHQKKLAEWFPGVADYQQDLARTHTSLGNLLAGQGQGEEARVEYQAALDLLKKLVAQVHHAVPEYQQDLANTHNGLGNLLAGLGQSAEARVEYQAALDLLKKLVAQFSTVPVYLRDLANTHNGLGILLAGLGRREEARVEYQAARDIQKKLVAKFSAVPSYRQYLASTHYSLGDLLAGLGQSAEAQVEYQAALDLQKKLAERFPDVADYHMYLARTHNSLGILLLSRGMREEARTEHLAALDLQKKLASQFPVVLAYRIDLGGSYCNYGTLICREGKLSEGLPWFDLAIRTLQPVNEKEPRNVTAKLFLRNSHRNRAIAYDRLRKPTLAVKDWDRAVVLSPPAERPQNRASRAGSQLQAGKVAEAIAEIAELMKYSSGNAGEWYNFACFYALASGKSTDKKQEYADRAMALLQKAVKAGYNDAAHMAKDTDLDPLRGRDDFKKLLAELTKTSAKPEKQP